MSGGPATLHASFLETTAAGPSARVRPREKSGGGGKAGNRDDETWHDAREECTKAYETVDEGPRERPDRGPCRTMLQAVWGAIRPWFVRPRPKSA